MGPISRYFKNLKKTAIFSCVMKQQYQIYKRYDTEANKKTTGTHSSCVQEEVIDGGEREGTSISKEKEDTSKEAAKDKEAVTDCILQAKNLVSANLGANFSPLS